MTSTGELNKIVERREALKATLERRQRREAGLSSTVRFAEITGNNCYDPAAGFFPWLGFHRRMANYFDKRVLNIAKPIKPVLISRGHLKTIVAAHALARYVLTHPEKRCAIISATDQKAQENLALINGMFKRDDIQELFPDILPGNGGKAREFFAQKFTKVIRNGNPAEPTIMALGIGSSLAGKHFDGVVWIDDVVTEDNSRTVEVQEDIWRRMQHVVQFVCTSGCEIWLTGTRYSFFDVYSHILDEDSPWVHRIVDQPIVMNCYRLKKDGTQQALFTWRYCVDPADKDAVVVYKNKEYRPVRESLMEIEQETDPQEFAAQMLNSPRQGGDQTLDQKALDHVLPVSGANLIAWLADPNNVKNWAPEDQRDRGMIDLCIVGDPAYSAKTRSDFSVLLTVAQDAWGHWYVMAARVTRDGWKGLEEYIRTAIHWSRVFGTRQIGVESHAKEALLTVIEMVQRQEGYFLNWHELKQNSNTRKQERIACALEHRFRAGKIHFCNDDPVLRYQRGLKREAFQFPSGVHDDCLDALANAEQVFPMPDTQRGKRGKIVMWGGAAEHAPLRRVLGVG